MSKIAFKVSITPAEALEQVKKYQTSAGSDLIHEELYDLGEDRPLERWCSRSIISGPETGLRWWLSQIT